MKDSRDPVDFGGILLRLRPKVCWTLIALFILSFLILIVVSNRFIEMETRTLGREFIHDSLDRTRALVDSRIQWLLSYTIDMSTWDATYELMQKDKVSAQVYFDEDLPDDSLGFDGVLFFRENGDLFHSQMLGDEAARAPFLDELEDLAAKGDLLQEGLKEGLRSGLLNLPSGPVMIGMSPILTTDGKGPSRGTTILVQRFTPATGNEIKRLSGIEMDLLPLASLEKALPGGLKETLAPEEPYGIMGEGSISGGYALLYDMNGQESLVLSLPFPEDLLTRRRNMIILEFAGMIFVFLILLSATFFLLQRLILDRLIRMATSLKEISASQHLDERLHVEGSDEITDVSLHINGLLDSVNEAQDLLKLSEIRYRTIFERSPISLWEEDFSAILERLAELREQGIDDIRAYLDKFPEAILEFSSLRRVMDINQKTLEILGAGSKEELLENLPLIYQKDGSQLMKDEIIAIAGGEESFEGEGINYTLDGRRLYVNVRWTIVRESGRYERVLLSVEDITERKDLEDRLRVMGFCDALTGLSNRALFKEEITRLESGRFDPLGLVSLDIDGLKIANDFVGHSAGDDLLSLTGKVLKKSFRESDVIARIGGDEFAVLLPQCDIEGLKKILERFQEELALENGNSPCSIPLSISVGWAWRENRELTIPEMLARADERMYLQKREAGVEYRKYLMENISPS